MNAMYKHSKQYCKDNIEHKESNERKESDIVVFDVNIIDHLKQHKINKIESLIYHIENVIFNLKNNYIFTIHNVPYNYKLQPKQIQNLKHEMDSYNRQLKLLEYCKRMNYDYVSDIPELVDKYYPIHSML